MSLADSGAGLLTLSRKVGEAILIDKDIRIVVVAIRKGQCKIGIQAPEGVNILRAELKKC